MKRVLLSIATAATLLGMGLGTPAASARPSALIAQSGLNCSVVESLGTALSPSILNEVNTRVSGESYRINRRKTLVLHRANAVSFDGCRMTVGLDVTLKRRVRRDAHGTVTLRGNISSFNLPRREVCYANLTVADVSLSRTLRIGEGAYRWAANRALPNSGCLSD